jgi:hypothetical protein
MMSTSIDVSIGDHQPRSRRALLAGAFAGLEAWATATLAMPGAAHAGVDGDVVLGATSDADAEVTKVISALAPDHADQPPTERHGRNRGPCRRERQRYTCCGIVAKPALSRMALYLLSDRPRERRGRGERLADVPNHGAGKRSQDREAALSTDRQVHELGHFTI